jgi:hypothetical protein
MRTQSNKITFLGLFSILLFGLLLNSSCYREIYCPGCKLTPEEESMISYKQNEKLIFKNDINYTYDTLSVYAIVWNISNCSDPCASGASSAFSPFNFFHLSTGRIYASAGNTPFICFYKTSPPNNYSSYYNYQLNVPTQNITVNNIIYNDVYRVQTDSIAIDSSGDRLKVPWKLEYSKSSGFIRFYMLNGETWSKQ